MGSVWLLTSGEYSDYQVEAAFSTKKKAELALVDYQKSVYYGFAQVEKMSLDEYEFGVPTVSVWMNKDGSLFKDPVSSSVGRVSERGFYYYEFAGLIDESPRCMRWNVATDDVKRAVKVVNEKRAIILANNAWGDAAATKRLFKGEA